MRTRRVLIAAGIFPPDIGGPATHASSLVHGLPAFGIEPGLRVFSRFLHLPFGIRHLAFLISLVAAARRADIVYALDPVSAGVPAALAARLAGRPFVVRVGGDYAWEQAAQRFGVTEDLDAFLPSRYGLRIEILRSAERWVAGRAARVVVPNNYLRSVVVRWGIPMEKVVAVPNAVDLPSPLPTRERAQSILGVQSPFLVSMGRLLRWKGFETLIDAVADLRSEVPGVSMAIVGSGPDAASLRRKVRQAGLEKTIRLVEALPRPESLTYLKAADLFVLNSAAEGMSHTIVEAMALGTPVVATDAGGTRELIDHGRSGWLVRHDAREDFGSAICALLSDPERAARMAEAAKRTVEAYSTDTMLRATVAALQDAR